MTALVSPGRSRVTSAELYDEVAEYFALGARVAPGDTVLDVGANIGAFALRVAEACHGDVRILAFEPSPETFAALATNFSENTLLQRTRHRLFRVGLSSSDRAGEALSFYDFARFPTNSTFHLAEKRREFEIFFEERGRRMGAAVPRGMRSWVERTIRAVPKGAVGWWVARKIMGVRTHTVRVDTLAHALADQSVERIDLLKIDVEGPELEILQGLDASTWAKVRQVVLETHDRDGRLEAIESLLRAHGLGDIRRATERTDNKLILVYAQRPSALLSAA